MRLTPTTIQAFSRRPSPLSFSRSLVRHRSIFLASFFFFLALCTVKHQPAVCMLYCVCVCVSLYVCKLCACIMEQSICCVHIHFHHQEEKPRAMKCEHCSTSSFCRFRHSFWCTNHHHHHHHVCHYFYGLNILDIYCV